MLQNYGIVTPGNTPARVIFFHPALRTIQLSSRKPARNALTARCFAFQKRRLYVAFPPTARGVINPPF
jgi:hypothetical protein